MIVENIKKYADFKGISIKKIGEKLGLSGATLYKAINSTNNIGTKILEDFILFYNDINPIWLITGKGEMLLNSIDLTNKDNKIKEVEINQVNEDSNTSYGKPKIENVNSDYKTKYIDLLEQYVEVCNQLIKLQKENAEFLLRPTAETIIVNQPKHHTKKPLPQLQTT